MLVSLEIEDLRSHRATLVDFAPRLTAFYGATNAGKTSIEDALSVLLAGANHWTTRDGKGAGKMVREGADSFSTRAVIDGLGAVERVVPRSGSQRLSVAGCDGSGVAENQAHLLAHLGVNSETLTALLDAKPVLERTPEDQFTYLLKAIRPAEIEPTEYLVEQGFKTINGVGHLLALIKERETKNLRDLNREEKALQVAGKFDMADPMETPPPGCDSPEKARELAAQRKAEHDKLVEDRSKLKGKLEELHAEIDRVPVAGARLSDAEYEKVKTKTLPNCIAQIGECERKIRQLDTSIDQLQKEANHLSEANRRTKADLEFLESIKDTSHCPTCERPWGDSLVKENLSTRLKDNREALEASEKSWHEKNAEIDMLKRERQAFVDSRDEYQSWKPKYEEQIKVYDAVGKLSTEAVELARKQAVQVERRIGELDTKIETADKRVANWQKFTRELDTYEAAQRQFAEQEKRRVARLKDLITNLRPTENRIIDELKKIKEALVTDHIRPFETRVNEVMKKLGQPRMAYDLEKGQGWVADGRGADLMSEGQKKMCFEVAFRLAVADAAKFPLVMLDHTAPVDEGMQGRILQVLYDSGKQVVLTWNTRKRELVEQRFAEFPKDMRAYWVEQDRAGISQVEPVLAEEKAA